MNTEELVSLEEEIQLLEDFQVEELEQRFEMTQETMWTPDSWCIFGLCF